MARNRLPPVAVKDDMSLLNQIAGRLRPGPPAGTPVRAVWKGAVIAESDETIVVEGNHYFPASAVRGEHLAASDHHSRCPWKGQASYHDVVVDGERNPGAAWYYPDPKPAAEEIRGRIAFWHGVKVEPVDP